jgi:cysteine desulfurase
MYANNEIGVIHQIREIGTLCREKGVVFHCDAVQAFGKVPVNVEKDQVDLMSVSAHKLYGPKGIGALFIRRRNPRVALLPQILGGGHERGFRSGTLNVPGIVAFGEACAICAHEMEHEGRRLRSLRDRLLLRLTSELPDVRVNGSIVDRLPNNLNVSFAGIDSEALLMGMPEIALSTGSACTSAMVEPSYVLRAIGVPDDLARGSVRFGLGRSTTEEDIEYVADRVIATVQALRALSPTGGRQTGISRRQLVLPEQAPES